ncbi:MAG: squalene/phytoene synthase family protein [Hyphomicrobiaceae bacterium]|nr:squalene/phytoene synthase family protein [Hyphomicrobiaceae bacterium]
MARLPSHDKEGDIPAALRDAAMRGEPDRYIAATLAPAALRSDLVAIAAFAAEIGRIPASVSEPMLGSIRLQWWRDVLAAAARDGSRTGHPVADAFARAVRRRGLDMALVEAMLEARELDLSGGLPSDDEGLWAYLDQTEGNCFRLAVTVAGLGPEATDPLARAAGRAYGIARALGRLPTLYHNGGLPLPADRLRAAGIDPDDLATVPPTAEVAQAIAAVAGDLTAHARSHLSEARALARGISSDAWATLLPLAMVEPYFRAQRPGPRLDLAANVNPLHRVIRIGLAHATGRF